MSEAIGLMPKEQAISIILASPAHHDDSINTALWIASTALHGQRTWDGKDYDPHYLRVGMNRTMSDAKRIIGILHDVVEDSDWTLDDLGQVGFSERVVNGVDAVTKRSNEGYFTFLERCSLNEDAIDVKINDLKDNMDGSRNDRFLGEHQLQKQQAYVVSYQYLVAIKKGEIEPGSSVKDFMLNQFAEPDKQACMDLYAYFETPKTKPGAAFSSAAIEPEAPEGLG